VGGFIKGGTLLSMDEGRRPAYAGEEDEEDGGAARRGRKRPLSGAGPAECPSRLYAKLTAPKQAARGGPQIKVDVEDEQLGFMCEVCHERITECTRQVRSVA
jgi:hypothetical protein